MGKRSELVEVVALFHNAGTVGNVELRSDQLSSRDDWHHYLQTNLISTILINNAIYSELRTRVEAKSIEFLAVDITSLLAITPFPSFTQVSSMSISDESMCLVFGREGFQRSIFQGVCVRELTNKGLELFARASQNINAHRNCREDIFGGNTLCIQRR